MTPGWLADLVWRLSGGRITRETEHYILHELPFTRAMSYLHCYWSAKPFVWTVALEEGVERGVSDRIEQLIARIREEEAG
ncbi:MAG TPA: hypothetical protein PLA50_02730 [Bacteroidia bacterium]|nr:hypothetical protein [Bacteroidia bacterium]